jgi:YHS domain-containing protein
MQLSFLSESGPEFATLKKHIVKLSDNEREKIMKAKAVWHFGKDGASSPAIKKAVVRGKTYFFSNTHRCFQCTTTLKAAIKQFFETVEPSS